MFDTQLSTWKHYLAGQEASPALAQPFTDAVAPFLAFLQEQDMTAPAGITPDLVGAWRKALQHGEAVPQPGGLVPSLQFFALRCFLRYLERSGDLPTDPAAKLTPLPMSGRESAQELTALEAQALLLAPDLATDDPSSLMRSLGWRDRAAMDLLYRTGVRPRQLLKMKVSAIPLGDLYIPGRPPTTARVALAADPHPWVETWIRTARPRLATDQSPDTLFLKPDGTALDGAGLAALVANAARQAGIPNRVSPTTLTRSGVEERRQRALRALRAKGLDICLT
ncbi:MAG TPA: tyrosine-type recombinase/integrase [Candidatus Xenobia bacterium]|jgi:site-specific recombinase XerD